ncbi:MAG: histidine--tRNA ligase [Candidatus Taylorbacteria bacterium RIFOXYD2_FULL_36_9]|uniref:Histidine--tRNA ligase n=1 Tax=Candidatus Taylorbacteria bacterium RIFOXYD2_FULL_36_9 TaxID=1802338 RepID=A0A1G2PF13_9BACT|nr:MAG: histidine--tRNA ligase [Candidatus Taylorbacteria bacterium RIFOXYD2_FULL_36_9]
MEKKDNTIGKLSTKAYKGVRDFYPEDMFVQNYIFDIFKKVCESYGYNEYGASVLEPADLYRAKSGEEIVNEQTYSFTDRGEREVTLRPEMTPTVARMVSARKMELAFPLRWYSIPNLFRYEKPQKGRLREHWQLNVDLFGVADTSAEVEVISLAYSIMKELGLKDADFQIRLNSRKIMNYILTDLMSLDEDTAYKICKLIDKKNKLTAEDFDAGIKELLSEKSAEFLTLLNSQNFEEFVSKLPKGTEIAEKVEEIRRVIAQLEKLGITNTVFDQTLMRGFDYYTGIVFEMYDNNSENKRSVFGGGRYDDLLSIFGGDKVPAFGFGAGDVIIRDILETYKLLPEYKPKTALYICTLGKEFQEYGNELAQKLREQGVNVAVDLTNKKVGDQIKSADKQKIPFIICLGEDEIKSGQFKLKNLKTGEEQTVTEQGLSLALKGETLFSQKNA